MKLKSLLNEKYLGFGNQGKKPVQEYGEDEFNRGPGMYSGGSKSTGFDFQDLKYGLEELEDDLNELNFILTRPSTGQTQNMYLKQFKKISGIVNELQNIVNEQYGDTNRL